MGLYREKQFAKENLAVWGCGGRAGGVRLTYGVSGICLVLHMKEGDPRTQNPEVETRE